MSYSELWSKNVASKAIASFYLDKYNYLLRWKDYKENILDVGCAEGSVTREILFPYINNHVEKLTAIDRLADMIDHAKKLNTIKEIDFEVMDAADENSAKEKSNQFDHIFSNLVANWIPNNRVFLTNLYKTLKPGGQIFQTHVTNHQLLWYSFERQLKEGAWSEYVPNERVLPDYTDDPLNYVTNLFEEIGFKVELCEVMQKSLVVKNFGEYIKSLLHFYIHLDRIPKEVREQFFQYHANICREYATFVGEPDTYEMYFETLICIASKT